MNVPPLFVGKSWQTKDLKLCLQVKSPHEKGKAFLILESKKTTPFFYLSLHKAGHIVQNGSVSALLRKHLEGSLLVDILSDQQNGLFFLFQKRGSPETDFFLKFDSSTLPFYWSLISKEKKILFRYGKKGTFTHVKTYDEDLPELGSQKFSSHLKNLLESYSAVEEKSVPKKDESSEENLNKELKKSLKKRLKTLKSSLEKLNSKSFTKEELEKERHHLSLLQSFLFEATVQDETLTLEPHITGLKEPISFPRDSDLSPGKNLSSLFLKLRKKEKGLLFNSKRRKELEKSITSLEEDLLELEKSSIKTEDEASLLEKHGIKKQEKGSSAGKSKKESYPYKLFKDEKGVSYFVGKSSSDNDELVKKARSSDLWFHAAGTQGSHVIIPKSSLKKGIDLESIKRMACVLALYYSKSKEDGKGEVYHTTRQHLKKSKKAAPGLWNVVKSETLFVSYDEKELKDTLDCMKL